MMSNRSGLAPRLGLRFMLAGMLVVSGCLPQAGKNQVVTKRDDLIAIGGGRGWVDYYPRAAAAVDAMVSGNVAGRDVTVHYAAAKLDRETAERFLHEIGAYQKSRERDYEILRRGLLHHLGEDLFARVQEGWYLQAGPMATEWYLLVEERAGPIVWSGPRGSAYHFLPPGGKPFTDGDLRPGVDTKYEVHSRTHRVVMDLTTSKRKGFPRWLEEGLCDYTAMQFERWRDGQFDGGREVLARLTWNRPAVQRRLRSWRHPRGDERGIYDRYTEEAWESDLLYKGSLGLVFSLEGHLGSGGLAQLFLDLVAESPETDRETRRLLEARLGRPIEEVGRMTAAARFSLLEDLLSRASRACVDDAPAEFGAVPLAALGHFPEAADRVAPVLQALVDCRLTDVAFEGLAGLRYLGLHEPLRQALVTFEERHGDMRDTRLGMAQEWLRSDGWFSERAAALDVRTLEDDDTPDRSDR